MLGMLPLPNVWKLAFDGLWTQALLWHRIELDGCDPKGHLVLFCVALKDRRAWEGISHAKTPKNRSYLCPLKTADFMPPPRPPRVPPPCQGRSHEALVPAMNSTLGPILWGV